MFHAFHTWVFWSAILGYLAFVALILYLDSRGHRLIGRVLSSRPIANDNKDWRGSMQVDLKQVVEILDKHIEESASATVRPYIALRRFRKDLIETITELPEENWDILQAPSVTCDYFPRPHTRDFGHVCKNPRRRT